jgi:DNA-binding NarL/FixJ family response regulator
MVQLTIGDAPYASALVEMLEQKGAFSVKCVETPDPRQDGVIVVDADGLERLPAPLANPERVVLITRNDAAHLTQAWNAGVRSVVFSDDPLSTAMLAIMAAELRVPKAEPRYAGSAGPSGTRCTPQSRRRERG